MATARKTAARTATKPAAKPAAKPSARKAAPARARPAATAQQRVAAPAATVAPAASATPRATLHTGVFGAPALPLAGLAQDAQAFVAEGQQAATDAWVSMMQTWFGALGTAMNTAAQMQAEMLKLAGGEASAGLLPLMHQAFSSWALPDPMTDRSLWWAARNWPSST